MKTDYGWYGGGNGTTSKVFQVCRWRPVQQWKFANVEQVVHVGVLRLMVLRHGTEDSEPLYEGVGRDDILFRHGYSVRCIKDAE